MECTAGGPNYVNFFDLMKRVGIADDVLRRAPGSEGVLLDGSSFSMRPVHMAIPRCFWRDSYSGHRFAAPVTFCPSY